MAAVRVGDIWGLKGTNLYSLVIFVRTKSGRHAEDVRVVPIYRDAEALSLATHRDVVVPPDANSFGIPLLAASWNARGLTTSELEFLVGRVDAAVVEAVRTVEMSCIIPNIDLSSIGSWQGPQPVSHDQIESASLFQRREMSVWDSAIESLQEIQESPEVLDKGQYAARRLRSGSLSYVSDVPVWFGCLIEEGEGIMQAFNLSPGLSCPGILGASPTELPQSGAVFALGGILSRSPFRLKPEFTL